MTRWPSNPGCLFLECLMGNCQYVQLQVSTVEHFRTVSLVKKGISRTFFFVNVFCILIGLIRPTVIYTGLHGNIHQRDFLYFILGSMIPNTVFYKVLFLLILSIGFSL